MNLRDCESLYKCGNGTDESCRKSLCPFYKPPKEKETKLTETKYTPGESVLDDFSGLWRFKRLNGKGNKKTKRGGNRKRSKKVKDGKRSDFEAAR